MKRNITNVHILFEIGCKNIVGLVTSLGRPIYGFRIADGTLVESLLETLSLASALFWGVIVNILNHEEICRNVFVCLLVGF